MDQFAVTPRRIRHISSIQICNLSPFPVRDAVASALAQPSEQSQFSSHGHLSDDLDVALARKRNRRISTASVTTLRNGAYDPFKDDAPLQSPSSVRGRNRAGSRVSFSTDGPRSLSGGVGMAGAGSSPPTIRPARPRTTSMASTFTRSPGSSVTFQEPASAMSTSTFSNILPDQSQKGLDKVLKSRLIETFIAITVPQSAASEREAEAPPSTPKARAPRRLRPVGPFSPTKDGPASPRSFKSTTPNRSLSSVSSSTKSPVHSPPLSPSNSTGAGSSKSAFVQSTSALEIRSDEAQLGLSSPSGLPSSLSVPLLSPPPPPLGPAAPALLSHIHRPSTNPAFPVSTDDFASWVDRGASKLRVEVYGRVGAAWGHHQATSPKGKGKEISHDGEAGDEDGWRVLESWSFDLGDLIPLPDDADASYPSHLPSNSLLITLAPFNKTYYLIPPVPMTASSRPTTPTAGYSSDPESDARRTNPPPGAAAPFPSAGPALQAHTAPVTPVSEYGGSEAGVSKWRRHQTRTAGWQDLVKLVTLQTCVVDTQQSLDDVVKDLERTMLADGVAALRRDVSERECRLQALRDASSVVVRGSDDVRARIEARRWQLELRREMLALAKQGCEDDVRTRSANRDVLASEKEKLSSLRESLVPVRTALISTLTAIFPIELAALADLLFTIVGVALPIPVAVSDPAPPLSLPAHKEVTEDAVATALGYAAQVVQMLAAYLGKRLVYPVTCVGSRSLIKDEISAMVGPRMFPLFSKGVDTYRFEYGVFLLNKDIELLMADRDLRALDIRHTLPNLKNLLLTLTDGEGGKLAPTRPLKHSDSLLSLGDLRSPVLGPTPEPSSPAVSTFGTEDSASTADTPVTPEPGSPTTPTAPIDASAPPKKARSGYFGLSPLTGFLRGRYPSTASSRPSVRAVPEAAEEQENAAAQAPPPSPDDGGADDEEDRRTLRGVPVGEAVDAESVGGEEQKEEGRRTNGHANGRVVLVENRSKEQPIVVTLQPASPAAAVR